MESVRLTELNPLHCGVSFLLLGLNILTKASKGRKGFITTLSGLEEAKYNLKQPLWRNTAARWLAGLLACWLAGAWLVFLGNDATHSGMGPSASINNQDSFLPANLI